MKGDKIVGVREFYSVLGLETDSPTAEEVKAAFREKAKKMHPDQGGDPEEFQKLKQAYDILSNPLCSEHYRRTGESLLEKAAKLADQHISKLMVRMINGLYEKAEEEARLIERALAVFQNTNSSIEVSRKKLAARLVYYAKVKERFSTQVESNVTPLNVLNELISSTEEELHNLDVEKFVAQIVEEKLKSMEYNL